MDILSGPVVVLDGDDCVILGRQLVEAIRLAYVTRGRTPPRHLLDFANAVSRAGRSTPEFRADAQVSLGDGTAEFRDGPSLPLSDQPVRLSVREAANLADVSEGFMRRSCRRGDVQAFQAAPGGAWVVDIASLAAWISARRRKEHDNREAA